VVCSIFKEIEREKGDMENNLEGSSRKKVCLDERGGD